MDWKQMKGHIRTSAFIGLVFSGLISGMAGRGI